jgi:hypothetical protein
MPFSSLRVDTQGSVYAAAPNMPGLSGSTADIGLLHGGGLVYTGTFTSGSPAWSSENWTTGPGPDTLDLLDSGESIVDGVQKPGTARTLHTATNIKARIFNNILDGTTVGLTYTLRATSYQRIVQTERGDPNICYILTNYSDGTWSEGHINGVPITPVRIGANVNVSGFRPPILVDPNNPLVAYAIAHDGTQYRWYKTSDGGGSWAITTDYQDPTPIGWTPRIIARSYQDPSRVFVSVAGTSGDPPGGRVLRITASSTTIIRNYGGGMFGGHLLTNGGASLARRGLRTYDSDPDVLFHVPWRASQFGNYTIDFEKSLDAGDNWTTIWYCGLNCIHNVEPGAQLGGDGSIFLWTAGTIRFHPNIYTITDVSEFTNKTGTGYPGGAFVPINLFGL